MRMNANEPREQGNSGWSQFGDTPPSAGGFPRRDTMVMGQPVPPPPPPPKRTRLVNGRKAVAGLALAAVAVGGGVVGSVVTTAFQEPVVTTTVSAPNPTFSQASSSLTVAQVAEKVQPSVVMIQGSTGEGSGVVLSADGLILTNNHVVEGAARGGSMSVKFSDGKTATATVVG